MSKETNKILEDLFYNKLDWEKSFKEFVKKEYVRYKYGEFLNIKPNKDE
jgi:hypothetical protein